MSKLIAGLLIGVTTVAVTYADSRAIAATTITRVTTTDPIRDNDNRADHLFATGIKPKNSRGVDIALDMTLYRAHRQMRQTQWRCDDSGDSNFGLQQRKRTPHIAMH